MNTILEKHMNRIEKKVAELNSTRNVSITAQDAINYDLDFAKNPIVIIVIPRKITGKQYSEVITINGLSTKIEPCGDINMNFEVQVWSPDEQEMYLHVDQND